MTQIIAHKGAANKARENTLEALLIAEEMGADMVEFDVRCTKDGILVLHHNASLESGEIISETDSQDLPKDIPSLAEALEVSQAMGVNVEIKNDPTDPGYDESHEIAVAVAGVLKAYVSYDKLIVSSFNPDTLDNLKACDPDIPTALLFFDPLSAPQSVEVCLEREFNAIHPYLACVSPSLVQAAHSAGLKINTWTVNEPEQVKEFAQMGVDGIITDHIEMARKTLADLA